MHIAFQFILIVVALLIGTYSLMQLKASYAHLFSRACSGFAWRKEFPNADKKQIRRFLHIFVIGFAFSPKHALKFYPTDKPFEIYRNLYPSKWQPDALEFETLTKLIAKEYSIDMSSFWHEQITLGEMFGIIHKP